MSDNRYVSNPVRLNISRSLFTHNPSRTLTLNAGKLVPFFTKEILPGDTLKIGTTAVIRMTTPVAPVMDDAFADIYYFWVPNDLILSRKSMSPDVNDSNHSWKAIIGAQDSLLNMPLPGDAKLPVIGLPSIMAGTTAEKHSLTDYLYCPLSAGTSGNNVRYWINALEPLAYYSVWNEYFRDPNGSMNPVTYSIGASAVYKDFDGNTLNNVLLSGYTGTGTFANGTQIGKADSILPVCRDHDYFTSCLPWPQRNSSAVALPLGDYAPLTVKGSTMVSGFDENLRIFNASGVQLNAMLGSMASNGVVSTGTAPSSGTSVRGTNVVTDLSNATSASINTIRAAFQMQKWYEELARCGNKESDLVAGMFNVTQHDIASGRPEYLGGKRVPITIQQVTSTAYNYDNEEDVSVPIGTTGAYSLTVDSSFGFSKSFDTWGTVIGVMCIRTRSTSDAGIDRKYRRLSKFDFYWPTFANLGEQSTYLEELDFTHSSSSHEIFGYQEAWAEYRTETNKIAGYSRPGNSQAYWNYADRFASAPTLGGYLNAEGQIANIDRTLQVASTTAGFQFQANIGIDETIARAMPLYSVPGLIDHN